MDINPNMDPTYTVYYKEHEYQTRYGELRQLFTVKHYHWKQVQRDVEPMLKIPRAFVIESTTEYSVV